MWAITEISGARSGSWLATWRPVVVYLAGRNSANTRRAYTTALSQFVQLARVELGQVLEWHIAGYKLWLVDRGLRPRTVRQRLGVLRSFFRWAIERGYHPGPNPAVGIPLPPRRGQAGRALTPGQVADLLNAATNDRDRALVAVLALCGLRPSEAVALAEGDYTTDRGRPILQVWAAKGGRDRRVPVGDLSDRLLSIVLSDPARVVGGPMFQALGGGGRGISTRQVGRIVAGLGRAAGLGKLSPTDLRRTFATLALDRGLPVPSIQRIMGHSNMTTTAGYYRGQGDPWRGLPGPALGDGR